MDVIYSELIPYERRAVHTIEQFGLDFPLRLEPYIFSIAGTLSPDYRGGYWHFYELSNGGFYMAPSASNIFSVTCENGYVGKLSPDALGVTACLYAYSQLSFRDGERLAVACAEHFHHLRALALDHPEARSILQAID